MRSKIKILKRLCLTILTFLIFNFSFSQVYPIQLSTQLIPPYSSYLPDYGDPTNEKLKCILVLQDFSVTHRDVKLEITITGNGYTIKTKSSFVPSPITLLPGTPQLITSIDLAPYLQTQNLDFTGINAADYELRKILPEGYYSICIRAVDYYNVNYTQVSNESCNNAWFFLNDPPFLNYPSCEAEIDPVTPQLLIFQWTAMNLNSPNSVLGTEYDFELFELRPNGGIPNNIVQNSAPVFSITTTQPFFQYSITEPTLYLGMNYVWRVRARDLSGRDLFKNEGWSQICTFTYGNINSAFSSDAFTLNLQAQASTHRQGKVWWNLISNFSQYHIQLRKSGTQNWFDYYSTAAELKINELEPSTTYEARVMGTGNNIESDWSNTASFTTQPLPNFNCNDQTQPINALSANPLLAATPYMIFQIGQFEMTATSITPDGAPGFFSGLGRITFYGIKIGVEYNHVYINDNLQITSGNVVALSDGIDAWLDDWMVDQAMEDAVWLTEEIDEVYVEDSMIYVITEDGDTLPPYEFPGMDHPLVINDPSGDQYIIYPDGTIEHGTWIQHSNDHLDATAAMKMVFSKADEQVYGFDEYKVMQWAEDYETILLQDSSSYFVSNKSIKSGGTDFVMAEFSNTDISLSEFSFTTASGQIFNSEIIGNKIKIRIENLTEDVCIYAKAGNLKMGKLNMKVYEEEEKEVVIIPLGNLNAGDITSITNTINQTFSQAVYKWNVSLGNSYNATNWDDNSNGKVDIDDYSLLNKYSDEMDKIRNGFDDSNIDKDAFILFVVPGFGDASVDGYMPYGRRFGFIKAGSNVKTFAHELGHGAFGLQHIFPDVVQGSTDNLLDYGSGNHLAGWQWDWMRVSHFFQNLNSNPLEILYTAEDEISPWLDIVDDNHNYTGFALPFLNGEILKIKNVKSVKFNRYGQVYDFLLNDNSHYRAITSTEGWFFGFMLINDYTKYAGKLLTAELYEEFKADLVSSSKFSGSGATDNVVSFARRLEGGFYLNCSCIYKWVNDKNYLVKIEGTWNKQFKIPLSSIKLGCTNVEDCDIDLTEEGVIEGVGVKLYISMYKNYEKGSTQRQDLAELANYFSEKIGTKKFAFYGYGLEKESLYADYFESTALNYFKDNNLIRLSDFTDLFPFSSDYSRDFEIIFSSNELRADIADSYNSNSHDWAKSTDGTDVKYEYSFQDLVLREAMRHSGNIWTAIMNSEIAGQAEPICREDFNRQYTSKYNSNSAMFFIAEWSARWAREPLIAYTFYRAVFLAPAGTITLVTSNLVKNMAIGGMVDYLLQVGIIYYFGEDDMTFTSALGEVDYYEVAVSSFMSIFSSANKIQLLVNAGAECIYNGFSENGILTSDFDYYDCGRGVFVALLTQKITHKVIEKLKTFPIERVYGGLQKLGGFSKAQLESLLTWLGFHSDDIARMVNNIEELINIRTNWLNDLRASFPSSEPFNPQGINANQIPTNIKTDLINGLSDNLPASTKENIYNTLIKSGSDIPTKKIITPNEALYKITPKGNGYSRSSFYMSQTEFDILKNSTDIEQKLGLPLNSHAVEYDIYKAIPLENMDVYESTVANTIQGNYITSGGAKQTFLLDDTKWTISLESNSLLPPKN
jgi:hypothetical protein